MSGHIIIGATLVSGLWAHMIWRFWAEAVDRTEERAPDRRYQNRPPVDRR